MKDTNINKQLSDLIKANESLYREYNSGQINVLRAMIEVEGICEIPVDLGLANIPLIIEELSKGGAENV